MMAGLIELACQKEVYIKQESGFTKQEFLQDGFEQIFNGMMQK